MKQEFSLHTSNPAQGKGTDISSPASVMDGGRVEATHLLVQIPGGNDRATRPARGCAYAFKRWFRSWIGAVDAQEVAGLIDAAVQRVRAEILARPSKFVIPFAPLRWLLCITDRCSHIAVSIAFFCV